MKSKGFHIELDPDVHEFFRRKAFKNKRSMAEEMRRVLKRAYLKLAGEQKHELQK